LADARFKVRSFIINGGAVRASKVLKDDTWPMFLRETGFPVLGLSTGPQPLAQAVEIHGLDEVFVEAAARASARSSLLP
jgi:hypothetical protein